MDDLTARVAALLAASELPYWLLGSLLTYVLAASLLWLVRARPWWPFPGGLAPAGRFLFFLVVPYLVLGGWPRPPFSGLLSLDELGFAGIGPQWPATRWLGSVGTGVSLGLAALVLLLIARAAAGREGGRLRVALPERPWWALPLDLIGLEVHWAFYRSALAAILGDLYAGVFLGLGLVYLEWALDPFWRHGWRERGRAAEQWLAAALALVAALVFLMSRNLWVCLAVHALVEGILRTTGPQRREGGQ